jgi:hypothetical protein
VPGYPATTLSTEGAAVFVPPIGLVHDYLLVLRGAQRSSAAMADRFPVAGYVLSSSSALAHGVRTRDDAQHVC